MKEYIKLGVGFYIGLRIARFVDKILKDLVNGKSDSCENVEKENT